MRSFLFLAFFLTAFASEAAVTINSNLAGVPPVRTSIASCTIVATPADADMSVLDSKCYRDGQFLVINTHVNWTGAGTAGAFTLSIASVTGSPIIDTAAIVNAGATATNQGETALEGVCALYSAGATAWFTYMPIYKTTTTIEIAGGSAHLQGDVPASGSAVKCNIKIPIVGWN